MMIRRIACAVTVVLLAGCEAARVAQPQAAPSPAEYSASAAAALDLSPADLAGASASLGARVQGWSDPTPPAAEFGARHDEVAAAEIHARAEQLERQIRAQIADQPR